MTLLRDLFHVPGASGRRPFQSIAWRGAVLLALAAAVPPGRTAPAESGLASVVVRHWLVEDGLPNDSINQCVRDGRGFLWLATASGLARFDGREFEEYPLPAAAPGASSSIRDIAVEDDNTLVMLPASGGVMRLRGREFSVHPAAAMLNGHVLMDLFSEKNGALWIGTVAGELARWENGRLQMFGRAEGIMRRGNRFSFARDLQGRTWVATVDFLGHYEEGRLIRFPEKLASGIFIAPSPSGDVWVSTSEQLLRLKDGRAVPVQVVTDWRGTESAGVQALGEDGTGALWIGTRRQGLFRFADGRVDAMPSPHKIVKALMADPEQNLWVATDGGGLSRLRAKVFTMVDAAVGLPDDVSSSVCEDAAGALWSADRSGGVVRVLNGRVERILPLAERGVPYAIAISPDTKGNVWVGASDGLYRAPAGALTGLQFVSRDQRGAHALFGSGNGDVWVSYVEDGLGFYRDGVFHAVTATEGHPHRRIKAIAEDAQQRIWLATDDRQVFEYVDDRLLLRVPREQMPGGLIYGLYFDAAGNLWITTARGLVLKQGGRLHLFTTDQGLPDNEIAQVLEDGRGGFWCSSRRGFFCIAKADLLAVASGHLRQVSAAMIGRAEGLQGASALTSTQPLSWRGQGGRLWFATHAGIVGIDPAAALPARPPPRVFIDEVFVDRRRVEVRQPLHLPAGVREVGFKFVALNYAAPEAVRMQHQLAGFDFDWVDTSVDRRASYARISPGHYTLRLRACNSDGRWDDAGVSLALTIAPAWWQTWWYQAGVMLAFTGLIVWGVRFWSLRRLKARLERLEREHALEKERARIARDLHDDLGGSLTQIGLLADRLKRQGAEPTLKPGLAQLAWRTRRLAGDLESIVWTVSPKNNTLDRLAAFIAQSVRGFFRDTGIECSIQGEEGIPAVPVAPDVQHHLLAILKEALNNVLKHAKANRVAVTLAAEGGQFALHIADDGIGFDPAAAEHSERNGLNNMRARVADLGGRLEIFSGDGRGTEIVLRQPLTALAPAARNSATHR